MNKRAISIVGECSNVGKTILIKNLLKIFSKKGLNVGVIKHHHKEFDFDKPGKDSYIFNESGAKNIKMISPNRVITIQNNYEERNLQSVIKEMTDCDFILVEGYKWENLDRIEVYRSGYSNKIISQKEKLIAIVTDAELKTEIKQYNYNDYTNIAECILEYFEMNIDF